MSPQNGPLRMYNPLLLYPHIAPATAPKRYNEKLGNMTPSEIIDHLGRQTNPHVFNPYRDYDPAHDRKDAVAIRSSNLLVYLETMRARAPKELWVAESGSHTGTRRSGLPLVPTTAIDDLRDLLGDDRFQHPTLTPNRAGPTAKEVWAAAGQRPRLPLFWNAVMAQPHHPDKPYLNRTARVTTLRAYQPALRTIIELFVPERIVAIGRVAARSLTELNVPHRYVRHPAQGGVREFRAGITGR